MRNQVSLLTGLSRQDGLELMLLAFCLDYSSVINIKEAYLTSVIFYISFIVLALFLFILTLYFCLRRGFNMREDKVQPL